MIGTNAICAVIVSRNPGDALLSNINAVRKQCGAVIVVDNGSTEAVLEPLRQAQFAIGFQLIEVGRNSGIAAALNQGVRIAAEQGFDFVLLLDQDSVVADNFCIEMLQTYASSDDMCHIATVAPRYIDKVSRAELATFNGSDGSPVVCMTSGSLMPVSVFKNCGWFDEKLFIDYVDIEYCLRFRAHGYVIHVSPGALLDHSLGRFKTHTLLGKSVTCTHHSPARRYYMTRNRIALYRQYGIKNWRWALHDSGCMVKELLKIVLFEDRRAEKLVCTFGGIRDALLNRFGQTRPL